MGVRERQRAVRAMRGQMWSPGRPSIARREDRQRFWRAIAAGHSSEEAAAAAGVSQAVGGRWFRDGGGMPPISLAPLSGRYCRLLSGKRSRSFMRSVYGVREIARRLGRSASTISRELRRNASTRTLSLGVSGDDGAVARRATREPPEGREARRERRAARVRAGAARRDDRQAGRWSGAGPEVRWIGRRHGRRQDRRWARSWSPEQIANRLPLEFPR